MKNISTQEVKITDSILFECEKVFSKKILEEIEFPDAIRGKEIYILNLVRVWFQKLSAKNRYKDETTQKLRKDYTDYMQALEDRSTHNYLSSEHYGDEDKTLSDAYREKCDIDNKKMRTIEDAFASAIGEEAEKELATIKALDNIYFSRTGDKAPDGFKYDLGRRELVPMKSVDDTSEVVRPQFKKASADTDKDKPNFLFPRIDDK